MRIYTSIEHKCPCGETDPSQFYNRQKTKCKTCRNKENTQQKRDYKTTIIDEMGGKCVVCGYNKCSNALEFHHLDPSEKDPEYNSLRNAGLERRRQEVVTKCVLLCANCHREVHAGVTTLP